MRAVRNFLLLLAAVTCGSDAVASDVECYDAKITAKPLNQVYTPYPSSTDVIVMSWPWFVDLKVKKVLEGDVPKRRITVLAVLHSEYPRKTRTFLLRRNTAGTFNLIRTQPSDVTRCDPGSDAAEPYIQPSEGRTLEDVRRESEVEIRRDELETDE